MLYKTCSIKSTRRWILVAIFKRNTDCVLFYVKQMICGGRLCFSILTDLVHKQWEKTGHVENFKSNFKHSFTRTVFFNIRQVLEGVNIFGFCQILLNYSLQAIRFNTSLTYFKNIYIYLISVYSTKLVLLQTL